MNDCSSTTLIARTEMCCIATTTDSSSDAHPLVLISSASAIPLAEDKASITVTPTVVDAAKFSSSAGLGNHKPGSNTRGGLAATAPSGRAAEAAKCPAVTRSDPRPGSHAAVSKFHQPGMTETAATNSDLACASSETAATAIPGSASAVAALLDLDAHIDMNTMTLRVAAMSSTAERSASS
jgi:hypothetical protein